LWLKKEDEDYVLPQKKTQALKKNGRAGKMAWFFMERADDDYA